MLSKLLLQPLRDVLSAIGALVPFPYYVQPVSSSVEQIMDLNRTPNNNPELWYEVWERASQQLRIVRQAMDIKDPPPNTETHLLAISEWLSNSNRWRDMTREFTGYPEFHDLLIKGPVELEDDQSDLTFETVLGMRAELQKMQESINSIARHQISKDVIDASEMPGKSTKIKGSEMISIRKPSLPSPGLPAVPQHVFGRDEMVEKVIGNVMGSLEQGSPQHTALVGAVGTGKSTVARVVANHVTIARAFGRARHWVSCQTLPTVKGLLYGLADSLSLEKRTTKPLEDIISYLCDNPSSLLIVFDDFSMPESAVELKLLEDALERLNQTARVHMLLTSRDLPLPGNVGWLHLLVQPLSPDAAVDTYKAISPYHDDKIEDLVRALDCNPFAIVVTARQGELGIYPAELLQRLRSSGRVDRSPVDHAIQMSLSCSRFASNPEALTFLAILAKLPKGAHYEKLPEIAPEIGDHWAAEATLLASGLATRETDGYVRIQAPTRTYLARNHVLELHHLHALRAYYFRICELCWQELGTKEFECAAKVLAVEGANAQAILLEALESDPSTDAIRAAIGYAAFLYHDVPSTDVIVKTIEVIEHSPALDQESILLPFCYFHYGKLSIRFDRHQEARLALEKAENIWAATNNHSGLGKVYNFFGQIYRLLGDEAKASNSFIKARGHCEKVQDHAGACESLRGLAIHSFHTGDGDVEKSLQFLSAARQHAEGHEPSMVSISFSLGWVLRGTNPPLAVELLTDARETYIRYGARYQTALCTYQLAIAGYESGRYDDGKELLLLAYQEFDALDNYGQMGFTILHLMALEEKRGDLIEALRLNSEVRSVFSKIQYHGEVARSLVSRGRVLAKMGHYVDAREAYEEARVILAQHNCGASLMRIINEEVPELVRLQQPNLSGK